MPPRPKQLIIVPKAELNAVAGEVYTNMKDACAAVDQLPAGSYVMVDIKNKFSVEVETKEVRKVNKE